MTDPLQLAGPALVRASGLVESRYARAAVREGITVQQSRILVLVTRRPRSMVDIGSEFLLGKSTMTGVIARLEAAGLVERNPDPADRRRSMVSATARGAEIAERVVRVVREDVIHLLGPVPDADRATLARILTTVIEHAGDD